MDGVVGRRGGGREQERGDGGGGGGEFRLKGRQVFREYW